MTMQMYGSRDPLTKTEITAAEMRLGISLPPQYRDFLLAHNGGRPRRNRFPITDYPPSYCGLIDFFLCVQTDDIYDLEDWVITFRDRIPAGFLPIAVDYNGNVICSVTAGENAGKVFFWDHEEEAKAGQTPGYENVYLIANSFQEFLDSLTED